MSLMAVCACRHTRNQHSGDRMEDFRCLAAGCECNGFRMGYENAEVVMRQHGRVMVLPARLESFLTALLQHEALTPEMVEMAVTRVLSLEQDNLGIEGLGRLAYPPPLLRAFVAEQARRLTS